MATISVLMASAAPDAEPDEMDDARGALVNAVDRFPRGLGARAPGEAKLPQGFLPLGDLKELALLGRWPLLEDRMSPCMPTRIVAAMRRRHSLGDQDAEAWLELHARACAGSAEAQRAFGRVCENGTYRSSADLQRAFFWYYRAGLQGDDEARRGAERLMRAARISPATMADPALVYSGHWRVTAHLSERLHSTSIFELSEDGTAAGWLIGDDGTHLETAHAAPAAADDAGNTHSAAPSYRGGWAYDGFGQILTIIFDMSDGSARRWRSPNWQIELLGARPGAIFGRDRRMVGYTLQHLPHGAEG